MTEQRQPGTGRIWTPRAKLPPCPICEKDELHVARWSASYKIKCLSCGWDSGIQACHDDSLVDNLIIQLVAITTAGYNAISAQLLNKSMLDTQPRQLTPQQRMVVRLLTSIANDLDRGIRSEQQTASVLHQVADAIERDYEAELVALVQTWRKEGHSE